MPAHNEEAGILLALEALGTQGRTPDEVVVIADNCVDSTALVARTWGANVHITVDNQDKKAGALNQVLSELLPTLDDDDVILVQDADSFLDPDFIAAGLAEL